MDARARKLERLGLSANLATALIRADFDTPAKIKAAEDADLLAVLKRQSALEDVRAAFPKA